MYLCKIYFFVLGEEVKKLKKKNHGKFSKEPVKVMIVWSQKLSQGQLPVGHYFTYRLTLWP